jgi:arylsulfatase A-like enzyme
MLNPKRVRYAAALSALLALCGCTGKSGRPEEVKQEVATGISPLPLKYKDHNLILVSFDALQATHVGCLGYSRDVTPTLDAVAREGFNFTNTFSVASWTVPASMTWFTGVYPSEHRMTNKFAVYTRDVQKLANLKELSPNLVTLADILKQNGYATGGFTGNAGVSGGFGYQQGFDIYYYEKEVFGNMDQSMPKALVWLKAHKGRKFFLFLHGYDIHGQNTPAAGFDYRFVDKGYDKKYTGSEREHEVLREVGLERGQLTLREEDVRFWRAIYDEKIQRTDEKFRRFLGELDKLGLTGKTLLVLTSDHGTEFYEHRRFDHGFTLYDEQIHVPLIVKLPGQTAGRAIADRISSIDVMPTVLDLLDVRVPETAKKQLRGTSLVPAMKGEPVQRDVFSETDYREYTYKRSVITPDGWKLIYTLENKGRELYNLKDDPGETKNLVDAEPKRANELERKLFAHFKSIGHDLNGRRWDLGFNPVYNFPTREAPKK